MVKYAVPVSLPPSVSLPGLNVIPEACAWLTATKKRQREVTEVSVKTRARETKRATAAEKAKPNTERALVRDQAAGTESLSHARHSQEQGSPDD